jgi:hypothetical protein
MVRILVGTVLMVLLVVGLPVPAWAVSLPLPFQPVLAQATSADWSAADIASFANAYRAIQVIKQEAESEMVEAVQTEGLTVEQFNSIVDSQLSDQAPTARPVPDAESAQFDAAVESIIAIRQTAEVNMQAVIEEKGLSVDTFNQIIDQAANDPDLRQTISEELNS